MTAILLLLAIWAAGGFAAIGALKGISIVEDTALNTEVYQAKFFQSWYAFGQIITILLAEIGKQTAEKTEKK
jgi:hypothetical protein